METKKQKKLILDDKEIYQVLKEKGYHVRYAHPVWEALRESFSNVWIIKFLNWLRGK